MTDDFDGIQRAHWSLADPAHERWRTLEPIRRLEETLYASVPEVWLADKLLDVGCGEADALRTLRALGFSGEYTGVDWSHQKLLHARTLVPGARLVGASATHLPFPDRAFSTILCRDLLHHMVGHHEDGVTELLRVAEKRVVIVEPNPFAPLVAGLGMLRHVERGLFRSSPRRIRRLLQRPGWTTRALAAEPHSLARLAFHYQVGIPALASCRIAMAALRALDRVALHLPRILWSYQVYVLERRK
jgi:SAM-dependent methyltransferase